MERRKGRGFTHWDFFSTSSPVTETFCSRVCLVGGCYCQVTITLLDVNDNAPVFAPSYYLKSVPDWYLANETILTVRAEDEDTGDNSHITYEIVNSTRPG